MKCDQTCIKTESCVKTGLRNITARVNEFIISVFAIAFSVMFTCYEKCQNENIAAYTSLPSFLHFALLKLRVQIT